MDSHHDEQSPLLGTPQARTQPAPRSQQLAVMIASSALILSCDFGFYLTAAPQTEVFQNLICENYMARTGTAPTEGICKSEPVQSELALVNGWKDTAEVLPGILLAVPYGVLADRWGRRPVLLLGMLGILLGEIWVRIVCLYPAILSLRLVWLTALWRLIGGGDIAVASVAMVMLADVFPEEEIATALFRLSSAVIFAEVLATPVSAYLMTRDPWLPFMLGLGIALIGSISAFFIPETLGSAKAKFSAAATESDEDETGTERETDTAAKDRCWRTYIGSKTRDLRGSTGLIFKSPGVLICLFALFVTGISRQSTTLLLQYTSKRFDWSIANSSLLISLRGILTLLTFLLLMPALSKTLTSTLHYPHARKDLFLSQTTSFISALGLFLIALAPSRAFLVSGIALVSLGSGFAVSVRSFVTTLVRPDQVGALYSAAAALGSAGMVVSGPLLAYVFRLGLRMADGEGNGVWLGMPFVVAGVMYALASGALMGVRPGADGKGRARVGREEGHEE